MKNLYKYSEKELKLIAYFGFTDLVEFDSCPPPVLYRIMAEKAFVNGLQGLEVLSLRRCLKALNDCTCYRMTQEWDNMIEFMY